MDAGLPIDTRDATPRKKVFAPRSVHADWILTTDQIPDFVEHGTLLDARSPARFYGEVEPIDPIAGHVPGAVNYFFEQSLDERARFLPRAQLRAKLGQFVHDAPPLGVMCGSGVTACHILLALEVAGLGGAKLYAGSWSEWIRDTGRPVATRDEA